ncbi:MAG TPA: paraquat-inducible protein A [Casimicrobiaceae bacterium]
MTALHPLALDTLACPDCDLQQSVPPLLPGGSARCARCRVTIARNPVDPIGRPLALSVAAAAVFLIANTAPLMGLSAVGREASTTILGGAREMWTRGSEITAVIVAFCAFAAPGAYIAFMLAVLLGAKRTPAPRWVGRLLRWAAVVLPWSMTEVMLLGILVALIKIAHLATVVPGIGLFAVGVLVVLLAVTSSIFEPRAIWNRVVWADGSLPPDLRPRRVGQGDREPQPSWVSAHPGLASCSACGLLSRPAGPDQLGECPRCGAVLSTRHHVSLQTTWALVIAAAVLFIPANAFPVLVTTTLGSTESSTILGGVVFLYKEGSWVLALIVLVASVVVPLGKLFALVYLMITVQRGSLKSNHDRTRLYRLVELIGRWSMLDVFVVAFIVALVQLDPLMSVAPGIGVMYFMVVVVLTMIAAHAFDPRLIWNPGATSRSSNG